MEDIAAIILSKLIVFDHIEPFVNIVEELTIEDLKDKIYDLYDDYSQVEDLIQNGYDLDTVLNNEELLEDIIELSQEPKSINMEMIDEMMNLNFEDLLEKKLNGEINL